MTSPDESLALATAIALDVPTRDFVSELEAADPDPYTGTLAAAVEVGPASEGL